MAPRSSTERVGEEGAKVNPRFFGLRLCAERPPYGLGSRRAEGAGIPAWLGRLLVVCPVVVCPVLVVCPRLLPGAVVAGGRRGCGGRFPCPGVGSTPGGGKMPPP
jgi:hypothetical protein